MVDVYHVYHEEGVGIKSISCFILFSKVIKKRYLKFYNQKDIQNLVRNMVKSHEIMF